LTNATDPTGALDDAAVAAAVGTTDAVVEAAGIPFHLRTWGDRGSMPVLLVHGVGASSAVWWRVGPALAAAGWRVVAPDLPGHGRTGHWTGHHRFRDLAADLLAFIAAAGLRRQPDLAVVGHSLGGLVAAELPGLGLHPAVLVLVDPPAVPRAAILSMLEDPAERRYDDLATAIEAVRGGNPTWSAVDVYAKAEALTQVDEAAARAILTDNSTWDGGLAALQDPAASDVPTWLIRGDPDAGGLIPDDAAGAFEERLGAERVITIPGAPHSPQRTHLEAFLAALTPILAARRPRS
jgi:pimeloyl-ACP methyl ester carboxylesterase